jgi:hypothetical protein
MECARLPVPMPFIGAGAFISHEKSEGLGSGQFLPLDPARNLSGILQNPFFSTPKGRQLRLGRSVCLRRKDFSYSPIRLPKADSLANAARKQLGFSYESMVAECKRRFQHEVDGKANGNIYEKEKTCCN